MSDETMVRETSTLNPRRWLPEIEGLRAIAFVFIVFGHAGATLHDIPHSSASMAWFASGLAITRFALPAFMVVSALLETRKRVANPGSSVIPGLGRLAGTYIVWTVFYVFLTKLVSGTESVMLWDLASEVWRSLYTGTGFYHLWYVVVAIQIYLVTPMLVGVARDRSPRWRAMAVAMATAVSAILLGQIGGPLADSSEVGAAVFGFAPARVIIFWLGYVTLGVAIGFDYEKAIAALRRRRVVILAAYALIAGLFVALVVQQTIAVSGDYQLSVDISKVMQPWVLPIQLFSVVAWLLFADMLMTTRLQRTLSLLAGVSFGGFLIHPLFLVVGRQFIASRLTAPQADLTIAGLFLFSLLGSVTATWLLGRLHAPLATLLVGTRPRDPAD